MTGLGAHKSHTAAAEVRYWRPVSAAGYGKCSTANLLMMDSKLHAVGAESSGLGEIDAGGESCAAQASLAP